MSSFGASEKGSVVAEGFCVTIDDENAPLQPVIDRELDRQCNEAGSAWEVQQIEASRDRWRRRLDYVTKTLLYLRSDGAELRHLQPYSAAPKAFPGLGRRKREEKLAQVDQLYDRYVVGPASLEGVHGGEHGERLTPGQELPAHWRRGHFRMQPHGPQSSLRKVIFWRPSLSGRTSCRLSIDACQRVPNRLQLHPPVNMNCQELAGADERCEDA